jgi:hypothetical protein
MAKDMMPALYERIHKHLKRKGMTDSHAWAVATNAVRKGCLTGDTNFPGKQDMNPISRKQFCTAYAKWKKTHPGGR